jgi:pimeloyl-ACP methyl ester carboxylesterase
MVSSVLLLVILVALALWVGGLFQPGSPWQIVLWGVIFAAATALLYRGVGWGVALTLGTLFVALLALWTWSWRVTDSDPNRLVLVHKLDVAEGSSTLIVLIHGGGGPASLEQVRDHFANITADWSRLEIQGLDSRDPDEPPPPPALQPLAETPTRATILTINYGSGFQILPSNSDATNIARGVSRRIQEACDQSATPIQRIILLGHSQGALIARKAFVLARFTPDLIDQDDPKLRAEVEPADWATKVYRLVLLAGMNRGWDISGHKPADMTTSAYLQLWALAWMADLAGTGKLALSSESGAPFVANLRLQWMRLSQKLDSLARAAGTLTSPGQWEKKNYQKNLRTEMPATVQLLGDIDDIVSSEDNKDLRATGSTHFTWIKVRGTGHADIHVFDRREFDPANPYVLDPRTKDEPGTELNDLGVYRRAKVHRAVTEPFHELQRENEEQAVRVDRRVKRIVFILHGIRDLGRWSAEFERGLLARWRQEHPDQGEQGGDKLVIVSPRYGYFGMGPFLVRPDRQKYVRWLMDEYTEALARYPEAKEVDFVCHSNGTYLLASALEQYDALRVNRVVFAGSVVRHEYRWDERIRAGQVKAVRNYVAADDLVVGLFPTLFEQYPMRWFGNDLGSAGFNGFQQAGNNESQEATSCQAVENVGPILGGHGALLDPDRVEKGIPDVVDFLLAEKPAPGAWHPNNRVWYWDLASRFCCVVWILLVAGVATLGFRVTQGARQLAWLVAVLYVLFLWWVLNAI